MPVLSIARSHRASGPPTCAVTRVTDLRRCALYSFVEDGRSKTVDTTIIEAIGYAGTTATIASYSMKSILALRVTAVASSFFFIAYSVGFGAWPLLITELIILPINTYRLVELLRERRDALRVPE